DRNVTGVQTCALPISLYSLFDAINLVFSFALRGAGDTRFVSLFSLALSWPLMVVPTYLAWRFNWGLYWAWTFASAYIIALAVAFLLRFLGGKWKSMRVIEGAVVPKALPPETRSEERRVGKECRAG